MLRAALLMVVAQTRCADALWSPRLPRPCAAAATRARCHSAVMRLPQSVYDLLPGAVTNHAIFYQAAEANWRALRACYPTEEAALAAVTDSRAVLLPYGADQQISGFYELGLAVDRSSRIARCYEVLQEKLDGEAETLEIITKNPGVLGSFPSGLEKASADDIRRAASVASGVNGFFGPARRFVESTTWWDEGVVKSTDAAPAPAPWPLGPGAADASDEEEEVELPEVVLDGTTYLYDFAGRCMGIEHLLYTAEGEPVAVWNPETQEAEEVEIEMETEDERG